MAADREGLREALASWFLVEAMDRTSASPEGDADALLALPEIADLLARADSAQRMGAERDEYAEALMKVAEAGGWQASAALHLEIRSLVAKVARLSAEVEGLRAALEPFAEYARLQEEAGLDWGEGEIGEFMHRGLRRSISTRALREARTALARTADKAEPEGVEPR